MLFRLLTCFFRNFWASEDAASTSFVTLKTKNYLNIFFNIIFIIIIIVHILKITWHLHFIRAVECGSAFIFCGYGSSSSSQCRSGSSCFFNAEPDPALKKLKKLPYGEFFGVEKEKKDCSKVKYHGAGPNLQNFIK